MVPGEVSTPGAAVRARDGAETAVGWALVLGGVVAVIAWVPLAMLPGGFVLVDAPAADEALGAGARSAAVAASLLLVGVAGVVLGLGVLRDGRAGLNRPLAWVAFAVAGVTALSQQAWLLGGAVLVVLAVVLGALRQPVSDGPEGAAT